MLSGPVFRVERSGFRAYRTIRNISVVNVAHTKKMSAMIDVFLHLGNSQCFGRLGLWGTHSCDEIKSAVMCGVAIYLASSYRLGAGAVESQSAIQGGAGGFATNRRLPPMLRRVLGPICSVSAGGRLSEIVRIRVLARMNK